MCQASCGDVDADMDSGWPTGTATVPIWAMRQARREEVDVEAEKRPDGKGADRAGSAVAGDMR